MKGRERPDLSRRHAYNIFYLYVQGARKDDIGVRVVHLPPLSFILWWDFWGARRLAYAWPSTRGGGSSLADGSTAVAGTGPRIEKMPTPRSFRSRVDGSPVENMGKEGSARTAQGGARHQIPMSGTIATTSRAHWKGGA